MDFLIHLYFWLSLIIYLFAFLYFLLSVLLGLALIIVCPSLFTVSYKTFTLNLIKLDFLPKFTFIRKGVHTPKSTKIIKFNPVSNQ